jgi:hypothetical protein
MGDTLFFKPMFAVMMLYFFFHSDERVAATMAMLLMALHTIIFVICSLHERFEDDHPRKSSAGLGRETAKTAIYDPPAPPPAKTSFDCIGAKMSAMIS